MGRPALTRPALTRPLRACPKRLRRTRSLRAALRRSVRAAIGLALAALTCVVVALACNENERQASKDHPRAAPPPPLAPPEAPAQPAGDEGHRPAPAPRAPSAAGGSMRATTAMKLDGSVDEKRLVRELEGQMKGLGACVPLIRKTDEVVGSLNLEVSIGQGKSPQISLRSPMNPEAERCVTEAAGAWRLDDVGRGRAMVLLVLGE
jgi:hypothetical protein